MKYAKNQYWNYFQFRNPDQIVEVFLVSNHILVGLFRKNIRYRFEYLNSGENLDLKLWKTSRLVYVLLEIGATKIQIFEFETQDSIQNDRIKDSHVIQSSESSDPAETWEWIEIQIRSFSSLVWFLTVSRVIPESFPKTFSIKMFARTIAIFSWEWNGLQWTL